MQSSFRRYLIRLGAILAGVVVLVWCYVALAPMAYLEGGYPAWVAKAEMLRDCRLGEVAFFGDSRLEAGVIPALLPMPASNLGVAAGTAVETRGAVRRALACPTPPRQAVISLSPEHFGPLSRFFWILSVRYGFIGPGELWETEALADRLGDRESFSTRTPDGFSGRLRDWLYAARFPSLSFSSLVQGRVFGRYDSNRARLAAVLADHGWSEYGPTGGPPAPPERADFVQTKLQTAAFEAALGQLRERGIDVVLLIMPFAESDHRDPAGEAAYLAYLTNVTRRIPGVHLAAGSLPRWPDRLFADGAHLAAAGARLFTQRLAACTAEGRLAPVCDLGWRPETAGAK
ncbi:MAG: hypothetical protein NVSMB18_01390 [Acetobacteraceae bacterium]